MDWVRVMSVMLAMAWAGAAQAQDDAKRAEAKVRVDQLEQGAHELYAAGKYAEARALAEEALKLAEERLGAEDPYTATNLNNLALLLQAMGDVKGARPLLERALTIREKTLGPDHRDTATSVNNLAMLLEAIGDLKGARPLLERALAICEKALGPDHPDTARALSNLAALLQDMGDLKAARSLFERALAIFEKGLGPDHPDTATSLNNLAALLDAMGDLKGARPLYERALAVRETALGADHPDTATSLNNLAMLLQDMGDLKAARPLFERALATFEKALGPDHPDTAQSLNNLAALLQDMGDLKAARPLYERALAIREKALGPEHPDTAQSLNNLARLLQALGDLKGARPLYERALAIWEKALGPDHADTATSLNNLAGLLYALGDLKGARPLFERALAICEKTMGPDHPDTATELNNLALLLQAMGDLKGARPLFERALAICEKSLGPDHPDTASSFNSLAGLLYAMGDLKGARPLCERAWAINRSALHWLLPTLSSRERRMMVRDRALQLSYFLSAFVDDPMTSYSAACAWKGAALRASATALRLPPDAPEEARHLVSDLADSRAQLAKLALSPPTPGHGEQSIAEQYDAARKRVEAQERALAALLPDLATRAFGETELADVQKVLPQGTALLDLIENCGNLHAWVVRPSGDVKYFPLGKAADLDPLAARFREALEKDDETAWKEAGAALRDKIEKPLAAALDGTKTLYLSPDGVLATVPWGLLPDGDGFLLERLPIVCVAGGAWMVMAARTKPGAGDGLLALGGIDYDHAEGTTGQGRRLDYHADPLSGSKVEVDQIAARFGAHFPKAPCQVVNGSAATVSTFDRLAPMSRYLHVATHGYFDLEHLRGDGRSLTGPMMSEALPRPMETERQAHFGWNPLLLSGIVMAGANAGDGGNGGDGLLTAEELQGLDLTGVELVVLSACETGRGELAAGEGVLGLSRALAVAGARGFMLSLWSVPDDATQKLMDGFYEGLWERGLTPADALRATQRRMIAEDRSTHAFRPSTWGAWILMQ